MIHLNKFEYVNNNKKNESQLIFTKVRPSSLKLLLSPVLTYKYCLSAANKTGHFRVLIMFSYTMNSFFTTK